jgi:hypothetical protein
VGREAVCSYCGHEGRTFSIAEVADAFEAAFEEHFYRTASEPSGMEYAMIKEGDYDWEREGGPVVDVISQCAKIEPAPAEDIQVTLQERHSSRQRDEMGEEGPFDEDAHYAERDVDDAESQAGWFQFEQSLKSQARYFSRWPLSLFHLVPVRINSLVFFGFYCLLIGYLIFRSTFLPRILGVLMAIAGVGWLTFLSPTLANHLSPYIFAPGIIGEGALTLWLLAMGVNAER